MKKKIYLLRIGLFFLSILFSSSVCLAQDSLNPHFTPENLSFKSQKIRLDISAKELLIDSNKVVILIGWGKKKSIAVKSLQKSKRYLMRKYKISSEKIKTVFGGIQPELEIKIFISDRNSLNPDIPN